VLIGRNCATAHKLTVYKTKMPACHKLAFSKIYFIIIYSAGSVAAGAGTSVVGTAGTAFSSKVLD
jgi:hypothetical protein